MLKNEIRGGLGIPPDWATMRGQAKKTNVFADAEKRVFRREKRIVQHPLIRFPSVWLNDIGVAPLFGRPHFIATHCLPDSRFNSKPFQYFVQTWIAADGGVQAPQGFFGFYGTARISPNGKIALTELKTFGIVQNGICVSLTAFPKGILSRIRENADGVFSVFSVFSVIKFKFLF